MDNINSKTEHDGSTIAIENVGNKFSPNENIYYSIENLHVNGLPLADKKKILQLEKIIANNQKEIQYLNTWTGIGYFVYNNVFIGLFFGFMIALFTLFVTLLNTNSPIFPFPQYGLINFSSDIAIATTFVKVFIIILIAYAIRRLVAINEVIFTFFSNSKIAYQHINNIINKNDITDIKAEYIEIGKGKNKNGYITYSF